MESNIWRVIEVIDDVDGATVGYYSDRSLAVEASLILSENAPSGRYEYKVVKEK